METLSQRQARINAKKVGLIDGDKSLTYKEINERVNRLSNALISLGLKKGEKVAFMANNCHEFAETFFAAAKAGLVIVPVNARFNVHEVTYTLNHSESNAFIYHSEFDEITKKAKPNLATVRHFVKIGEAEYDVSSYEVLIGSSSQDEPQVPLTMDDWVMIMYTSGATGEAKGVVSAQRNLMAMVNSMTFEVRVVPEDRNLLVMPMFHAGGLWPLMTHFYRGATTVILSRFDEEKVLEIIEKEKITFLNLVPTTLRRLSLRPDLKKYDLSKPPVDHVCGCCNSSPSIEGSHAHFWPSPLQYGSGGYRSQLRRDVKHRCWRTRLGPRRPFGRQTRLGGS